MTRSATLRVAGPEAPAQPSPIVDDDRDVVSVAGFHPLIHEGVWLEAKFVGHDTAKIFNTGKLFLRFEIVEPGPHLQTRLFRAFRVRKLVGRPGPAGSFVAGARSDLYVLLVRLLDLKLRADRISLRPLRHMLFRVRTRTVRKNHAGEELPPELHYTVVDEIVRGE